MYSVVINYEGRERKVGTVEDNVLTCRRDVNKHLFRSGRATVAEARKDNVSAWGLDCKVCEGLLGQGVTHMDIVTREGTFRCRLVDMKELGYVLNMKPHRAQYFLPETYFAKVGGR
jgi:hypothetical protein